MLIIDIESMLFLTDKWSFTSMITFASIWISILCILFWVTICVLLGFNIDIGSYFSVAAATIIAISKALGIKMNKLKFSQLRKLISKQKKGGKGGKGKANEEIFY